MTLVSFGSQPFRYGIILKDLHNEEEARKMMIKSLVLTPLLWSSWQELAKLCKNREMVSVESINNKNAHVGYGAVNRRLNVNQIPFLAVQLRGAQSLAA